jgi:hypothetical protein
MFPRDINDLFVPLFADLGIGRNRGTGMEQGYRS